MNIVTDNPRAAASRRAEQARKHMRLRGEICGLSYAEGLALAADMLDAPSGEVGTMRTDVLLAAIRQWGNGRGGRDFLTDQTLALVGVHRARVRVGELTDRQRHALATRLRSMAPPKEGSDA